MEIDNLRESSPATGTTPMDIVDDKSKPSDSKDTRKETNVNQPEQKEVKPEEKPEPDFEILNNPARVTRAQLSKITFDVDPRYVPITEGIHGIVMLKDKTPGEKEEIIPEALPTSAGAGVLEDEANEPEPPEPFEFLGK